MTSRSGHLDPATIAALVERTLDAPSREAVMAHLAACADCREIWAETSEMAGAESPEARVSESQPKVVAVPRARRRWIYSIGGLAAAAAVVLAVVLPRVMDRGDRPELRELVEAVGENRRTEARLTGGFKWGPVPSVTRGADAEADAAVTAIAAKLEQRAEGSTDTAHRRASAAALLVTSNPDGAIRILEPLTATEVADAGLWADLAAAWLERARRGGGSDDALRAVQASDRALAINPKLVEALFNRALALSRLGARQGAEQAWRHYLEADSSSPWAAEARTRLAAASRSPLP